MQYEYKSFIADDGAEIKYIDEGSGPIVLYIYGIGSSISSASAFIDTMTKSCRFIIFDQRGFGITEAKGELGIHQSARDAHALIQHLNLKDVILFGYSMGAAVVFSYIRQFGNLGLKKILIGDMSPKLINEGDWKLGLYQGHYTRTMYEEDLKMIQSDYEHFALILTEQLLAKNHAQNPRNFSGTSEEIRNRILSNYNPLAVNALFTGLVDLSPEHCKTNYYYWETMASADFRDVFKTISVPCGLLYADPGSGYQPDTAKYMQSQIQTDVEMLPIENSSHMASTDNPKQFIEYITHFVTQ